MHRKLKKFIDILFENVIEQSNFTKEEKDILINQFKKCNHEFEITGKGFFDYIYVENQLPRIHGDNMYIGNIHIEFIDSAYELGEIIFIKDGYIKHIEIYSYDSDWDFNITDFNIYRVEKDGSLSFLSREKGIV